MGMVGDMHGNMDIPHWYQVSCDPCLCIRGSELSTHPGSLGDPFKAAARNLNKLNMDKNLNHMFLTDIDTRPRIQPRPKPNPRIIRYIQIIKTTGKSSQGLMRSTGRSKPGSSDSAKQAQANRSKKRRRL
ncbi:hypothetical protein PM082_024742 [Marasmius tenuissimus]|nr:hypothetical protein PM082_024742 [Marasmius tenuissimus]